MTLRIPVPRRFLALALAGALAGGIGLPPAAARTRFEGGVKAGVEDVDLDRFRLRFDSLGNLIQAPVREGGVQSFYSGSATMVNETDLPGGWIWDTEARLDLDVYSATQISSERFDRVLASGRSTLARPLGAHAYGAIETRFGRYVEQFLPDLEATTWGVDAVYDREYGGDGYLQLRVGTSGGELANNPGDSYVQVAASAHWQHLPPDRLNPEVLPFHKPDRALTEWEFLFGHALELDKARDLLRITGDAVMLADLAPDPPLPRAWNGAQVRPHLGIRESVFSAGAEVLRRQLDSGNDVDRLTGWAGIEWSLTDFVAIGVRDAVTLADWTFPEPGRIRSDRLENHFVAEVTWAKERSFVSLRAGLDSHFLDDFERLDYNRGSAGVYGSYDTGGKYRIAGYIRGAREHNLDERGDFPDLSRFDSYAALHYRLDPRAQVEVSYLRQRMNVTGPQSEFDSAYLDQTTRVAYRRRMLAGLHAEAGYQLKDEGHEFFTENDRRDSSVFGSVEYRF